MPTVPRDDPDRDAPAPGAEHLLVRVGVERFALPLASVREAVAEPALRDPAALVAVLAGGARGPAAEGGR